MNNKVLWVGLGLALVVTLAYGKWVELDNRHHIAVQQAKLQPMIDSILDNTAQSYRAPMELTGSIQDFAVFGKVKRFANRYHTAVDYYAQPGTPVYAVADGVIYFSGDQEAYGGLVVVTHPSDGLYSLYGHVSARRWLIEKGSTVSKGEVIGYIADTDEGYGIGSVPHLHFSLRLGDPDEYPKAGRANWMSGYTNQHPAFERFIDPERFIAQSKRLHRERNLAL